MIELIKTNSQKDHYISREPILRRNFMNINDNLT